MELRTAPTLDDLSRETGVSRAHLAREFAETFGIPPHQYLVQLRIDAAKRALAAGTSVTEVCYELGFESLGSF
jgi:AraC-like DNA-binding protein